MDCSSLRRGQDQEYRCYVHEGRLNAISQYHCFSVFAALQDAKELERVRDAICAFHERVKPCFAHLPSYVFDVVVLRDGSVQIIELNPL